jgi:hypothetical protein
MAAGKTYEPIATTTLSSATSTITFSSIPGSYTDLVLIMYNTYSNTTTANENVWVRINNDSGGNYSSTYMEGGLSSGRASGNQHTVSSAGNNTPGFQVITWNFYNYSNTTTFKSSISSLRYAPTFLQVWANLWRNTAAINRIDVIGGGSSSTFAVGSTFTLYGIAAA